MDECFVIYDEFGYQQSDYFATHELKEDNGKWTYIITKLPKESIIHFTYRCMMADRIVQSYKERGYDLKMVCK